MSKYQAPIFDRLVTSNTAYLNNKDPRLSLIIRSTDVNWLVPRETFILSCLSKRSYNPSLKWLLPANFFREVTHIKHFIFQSSRWSTEQEHTIASQRWLWSYFLSSPHLSSCLLSCSLLLNPTWLLHQSAAGVNPGNRVSCKRGCRATMEEQKGQESWSASVSQWNTMNHCVRE